MSGGRVGASAASAQPTLTGNPKRDLPGNAGRWLAASGDGVAIRRLEFQQPAEQPSAASIAPRPPARQIVRRNSIQYRDLHLARKVRITTRKEVWPGPSGERSWHT